MKKKMIMAALLALPLGTLLADYSGGIVRGIATSNSASNPGIVRGVLTSDTVAGTPVYGDYAPNYSNQQAEPTRYMDIPYLDGYSDQSIQQNYSNQQVEPTRYMDVPYSDSYSDQSNQQRTSDMSNYQQMKSGMSLRGYMELPVQDPYQQQISEEVTGESDLPSYSANPSYSINQMVDTLTNPAMTPEQRAMHANLMNEVRSTAGKKPSQVASTKKKTTTKKATTSKKTTPAKKKTTTRTTKKTPSKNKTVASKSKATSRNRKTGLTNRRTTNRLNNKTMA
jgi:hypothetical protein